MLTEERYAIILEQLRQYKSVKLPKLCELLDASESTVRRDLTELDERGLIKKVHGGAIAVDDCAFNLVEQDVESKSKMFTEEKIAIARYAASLVDDRDFVFIVPNLVFRTKAFYYLRHIWLLNSFSAITTFRLKMQKKRWGKFGVSHSRLIRRLRSP